MQASVKETLRPFIPASTIAHVQSICAGLAKSGITAGTRYRLDQIQLDRIGWKNFKVNVALAPSLFNLFLITIPLTNLIFFCLSPLCKPFSCGTF
jgi:hypothetical protein